MPIIISSEALRGEPVSRPPETDTARSYVKKVARVSLHWKRFDKDRQRYKSSLTGKYTFAYILMCRCCCISVPECCNNVCWESKLWIFSLSFFDSYLAVAKI